MKYDYKLYVIIDRNLITSGTVESCVEQAVEGGAGIIQLNEKNIDNLKFYETALRVKEVLKGKKVPLIINSRVDIALATDADGVHIERNDLPVSIVRKLLGKNKIIGATVSNIEESKIALSGGANYLCVGSMFASETNERVKRASAKILMGISASFKVPVIAIGGITQDNVRLLSNCGMSGIAVSSAVVAQENIKEAAQNMLKISKEIILSN